jgi:8-oxo-dGTP pyrophosphatase MutT (NUDIX family)
MGVPTGIIDTGESITAALVREVSEETGYVPQEIVSLGQFIDNPYSQATNHFFVTRCVDRVLSAHGDGEDISTMLVSPEECEKMILDGTIECCFTPAIYFLAKEKTNNFTNFNS